MSENKSHFEVQRGSERSFGVVFTVVFVIIALIPLLGDNPRVHYWALAAAGVFALVTVFMPGLLKPLNLAWFKLGMLLGAVIAPLVMMAIFFLVITPIGLIMKAFGKDLLSLKKPERDTYWIKREQGELESSSMKNQF